MNPSALNGISETNGSLSRTTHLDRHSSSTDALAPSAVPRNRLVIETTETVTAPAAPVNGNAPASATPKKTPRRRRVLAGVAVGLAGLVALAYYWVFVAPYESTDDAFIEAEVTPIAPQVAGRVARLLVADNQRVERGQVLLEIDPSDFQAKLDQARAILTTAQSRLEQARAQFAVDHAKIGEEQANVAAAAAEADHAAADARRFQAVGTLGVSDSQLELAATRARSTAADLDAARHKLLAAEAQEHLDQANVQSAAAAIAGVEAAVRQAELNLSYTRVTAPVAGVVTHRAVEAGAYVQAGQALLALVPRDVWVVANFKETQLARMHEGQPVTLTVDAYPQLELAGHVESIQSGSGARFSLLPPENATGNFVKVVQRVPVKIALDRLPGAPFVLGPGMSVVPEVRIR